MTDWERIEKLLRTGRLPELVAAVRDLGPAERKALVAPAKEFERRARDVDSGLWSLRGGLSVIGAGVLPGASTLAPWLVRNGLWTNTRNDTRDDVDLAGAVLEILQARAVPWLADLAERLAARLPARRADGSLFRLVTELVQLTGIDPPSTDGMVFGWVVHYPWRTGDLSDSRWLTLLPRLFEVAGAGREIDRPAHQGQGWPEAIARFAADGRADRTSMIDGALGALQRGGRLGDVRGYLMVYEALSPDLAEVAGRARDYVPLLADGHSPVAGMAQRELFRVDDVGGLDVELLLDGSRAVFLRSEKKLIRAQIERLRAVMVRDPERVDDVLGVLAALFGHEAADIQASALDVVIAHAAAASESTRDELAAAASDLPADLRAKAAKVFGAVEAPQARPMDLPPVLAEPEFPPPIASLAELVEQVHAYQASVDGGVDMVQLERLIPGLVAFAYQDREGLIAALDPLFAGRWYMRKGHRDWSSTEAWSRPTEQDEMTSLLGAAAAPCDGTISTPYPQPQAVPGEAQWRTCAGQDSPTPPQRVLVYRLHEISVGLAYAPRPALVATPTEVSGLLAPQVLVDRLTRAAAEGWEPWEHDLSQALLRLPDERHPALADQAEALGTDAGKRVAQWLRHQCPITDAGLLGRFLAEPIQSTYWYGYFLPAWSGLIPGHPEVIAGYLIPYLRDKTLTGRGGGRTVTAFSHTVTRMGELSAQVFAHALDAHDKNDRAEAVDALLVLAARGRWNPAALGAQIGRLAGSVDLSLNRVVPCLRDLAQSGAARQVWDTIAAALPPALSPDLERPPQRLADLLALAVELVEQVRPTTTIPELAPLAARRGSSRIITEAKRLTAALSG